MEKKAKSKPQRGVLLSFAYIILPIVLAYFAMFIWTLYNNENQTSFDPSWIIGLGLAPLAAAYPWTITGVLIVILGFFALPRRWRFRFLLTLTVLYALIMMYMFLGPATYTPSIYY